MEQVKMKDWEFVDTVYSEIEAKHMKTNMEKSGYAVKIIYKKTPSEIPSWWILTKTKGKGNG